MTYAWKSTQNTYNLTKPFTVVAIIRTQPRSTSRPRPIITTIHITTTRKIIEEKSWSKGTFKQSCSVKKPTSIPPINFYFSQNNRIYGPDSQQIHSGKVTNPFVRNFGISKRSTCQENKSCPSPIPKHLPLHQDIAVVIASSCN